MTTAKTVLIEGWVHTIEVVSIGAGAQPWPFRMTVTSGQEQAAVLLYPEDIERLVVFFRQYWEKGMAFDEAEDLALEAREGR